MATGESRTDKKKTARKEELIRSSHLLGNLPWNAKAWVQGFIARMKKITRQTKACSGQSAWFFGLIRLFIAFNNETQFYKVKKVYEIIRLLTSINALFNTICCCCKYSSMISDFTKTCITLWGAFFWLLPRSIHVIGFEYLILCRMLRKYGSRSNSKVIQPHTSKHSIRHRVETARHRGQFFWSG